MEPDSGKQYACMKCLNCAFLVPNHEMFDVCPGCNRPFLVVWTNNTEDGIRRQPFWRARRLGGDDAYLKSINWDEKVSLWLHL